LRRSGGISYTVTGGPLFKKELEITGAEKMLRDEHWFLDIKTCKYKDEGV
jgi:hypothetical protein